tara:strand:- start:1157 stop:2353 length:1197 start_codon:yes stop_codon:yes gene_type:complete
MFTHQKVIDILETPLASTGQIIDRQKILKGFTTNNKILKDYSYSPLYLNEVYFFLNSEKIEDLSQQKLSYKIFVTKKEKARYASKFNQLIILFNRLQSNYFSRLEIKEFTNEYEPSIKRIIDFLSNFELQKYEYLIRNGGLKDKHIISLTKKINEIKSKDTIATFWEDLFLFEAYLSISLGIIKHDFSFPEFSDKGIKLIEFYHPLIENPVKNNFETISNVIVLNGPNMSGKSTFLKSIGLCVYLGHIGLAIPASYGEIPFCNNFSIAINRRDDILNGYSHFMTEVVNLKKVVKNADIGQSCFAVFDELFSGTNVEDAFDICKTTINGLSKYTNSFFFISTHIQELKNVSNHKISNYYIDCELTKGKPTFTYKLKKGWSEIKVGRILFDKEGLNELLK